MRLIDADALIVGIKELLEVAEDNWEYEAVEECKKVIEEINEQPTIQPQTGKWDSLGGIMDVGDGEEIQCNKCKATYMIVYRDNDYNFCPNCGAIMR